MTTIRTFQALQREVAPERAALENHLVYAVMTTVEAVRLFMEHHVFAVWDFMSLLKRLQQAFTCVDVPWVPRGDLVARRLVNEIVMGEESDDGADGGYTSHFELYLAAMRESGANVEPIEAVIAAVRRGLGVREALACCQAPAVAQRFVECTFAAIESRSLPRIAAAFTIGREEVIPDMFTRIVAGLSRESGGHLSLFVSYLERHIQIDAERHGPMAARLIESLCGDSESMWGEAIIGSREALLARRGFWDGIANRIRRATAAAPGASAATVPSLGKSPSSRAAREP